MWYKLYVPWATKIEKSQCILVILPIFHVTKNIFFAPESPKPNGFGMTI